MSDKVTVTRKKLADFIQNPSNPVRHTPRNLGVVVQSIQQVGAARSGFASKGKILAGNLTWEAMQQAGIEEVIEVNTDGKAWVIVNRDDLSPEQEQFLAVADQRASELGDFDPAEIAALAEQGMDMTPFFSKEELQEVLSQAADELLQEQIAPAQEVVSQWLVQVTCPNERNQAELLDRLIAEGYECRALVS